MGETVHEYLDPEDRPHSLSGGDIYWDFYCRGYNDPDIARERQPFTTKTLHELKFGCQCARLSTITLADAKFLHALGIIWRAVRGVEECPTKPSKKQ